MDINKLIPDEEVELTEILMEQEAALSSDPNEIPEYRYSKVEDKLAKLANEDMDASASAMKAELFKDAVSGGGGSEPTTCTMTVTFSQAYGTPSIGMTKKWDDEWKQYQAMSFSSGTQTYTDVAHAGLVYVYVNKADATITVSPGDGCYVVGNGTWTAAGGQYPCVLVKLAENASAVTFTVTTAHA